MTEVGLPLLEGSSIQFHSTTEQIPRLAPQSNYLRIGFDYDVPLCLDERTGHVVAVETELGGSVRFINSSVEQFGAFLTLYEQYRQQARTVSEEEILKIIPAIAEQMRKIDATAFAADDNYWPLIVEQMNQGLL